MKNRIILASAFVLMITTVALAGETSYSTVQPIFKDKCGYCHGTNGGFPVMPGKDWTKYEDAFSHKDKIKNRILKGEMPPRGNTKQLTDTERSLIESWVNGGGLK
jgi:uncharacterized membrane protein